MNKRFWFLMVTLLAMVQGTWAQGIPYVDRSWDEATQRVVEKIDTCKDYRTFGGYDEWFGLYDKMVRRARPCAPDSPERAGRCPHHPVRQCGVRMMEKLKKQQYNI